MNMLLCWEGTSRAEKPEIQCLWNGLETEAQNLGVFPLIVRKLLLFPYQIALPVTHWKPVLRSPLAMWVVLCSSFSSLPGQYHPLLGYRIGAARQFLLFLL
jgi:hypothetical protein